MTVDGGFFIANMAKILQGGYIPLLLASAVYSVMWIWHRGATAVHNQSSQSRRRQRSSSPS